ncbi:diacylglycerol kinase family lipid kinase [Nakamurella antarctica]|uniref:Diacylglycerol kinase family lipid kinase n=1 Tax=Nakamurella antarctica TaxID=1902245 RepID=A0A3G8ZUV6_9ACTN|nr:diacylglycerol kinase family protein [Nakamurella antarctica]AZI57501.1 diacylglycerol kinase family lipid kinase [Nakamurella antarctica]
MRALLIVNPHATGTTARRRDFLSHALASQMKLRIAHTENRGHAAELAGHAATAGFDLVVVHAGDGTVNEVVNGLLTSGTAPEKVPQLAIVPGGSTNVFARALGMDADPTEATAQILEALSTRRSTLVSLGLARMDGGASRYFTFNAGLGIDASVVSQVEKHRATGRSISNAMHVREAIKLYLGSGRRPHSLQVELPTGESAPDCRMVFVSNVDPWTYFGNRAIRTNPTTTLAGGLGVFASRSLKPITLTRIGLSMLRKAGNPRSRKLFRVDNVSGVKVTTNTPVDFQMDGDYLGQFSRVEFVSVKNALRVVV